PSAEHFQDLVTRYPSRTPLEQGRRLRWRQEHGRDDLIQRGNGSIGRISKRPSLGRGNFHKANERGRRADSGRSWNRSFQSSHERRRHLKFTAKGREHRARKQRKAIPVFLEREAIPAPGPIGELRAKQVSQQDRTAVIR